MPPQVITNTDLWLSKIYRMQRLTAGYAGGGGGGSSTVEFVSQFKIGNTPGAPTQGSTDYPNPALSGKTFAVHKNGFGYLQEGTDFSPIPGGGFSLLGGSQFYNDETYTVFIV